MKSTGWCHTCNKHSKICQINGGSLVEKWLLFIWEVWTDYDFKVTYIFECLVMTCLYKKRQKYLYKSVCKNGIMKLRNDNIWNENMIPKFSIDRKE